MKKKGKLLHVISIILIVFGVLGVLSNILLLALSSSLAETYASMGIALPGVFETALSWAYSIFMLIAGIVGVAYKSRKLVLIMGIIITATCIISMISTTMASGFSALSLISFIWPLLYLWGWYQSN